MTITRRLLLAFGFALLVALLTGIIGFTGLSSNAARTDRLID